MRTSAVLTALVVLVSHLGISEATQEKMSPSEDSRLAARATQSPGLEEFKAGQSAAGLELFVYAVVLVAVAAFSVAVGHLIAFPLGYTHSSQGRNFVPADSMKGNSKTVNYFNVCGIILGFPLYCLGYLAGLPSASDQPAKTVPADPPPPSLDLRGDLGTFLLGHTTEAGLLDPRLRIVGPSAAAERAGLETGDVVLEIDDEAITRSTLPGILARHTWGDTLDVAVLREGCRLRTSVVLSK
jgi:hypothetical protein